MATIFVSAVDGSNTDNGTTWALAKQTVAGALAIAASGDVILVDNAGTFTASAAITWTPPAGNIAIISVNRSGGDAWAAGAVEEVGASSNVFRIAGAAGSAMFVYGMTMKGGVNSSASCTVEMLTTNSVSSYLECKSCTIDLNGGISNTPSVHLGSNASGTARNVSMKFDSCTFVCSGSRAGTFISLNKAFTEFVNPTISCTGATKPAVLFASGAVENNAKALIRDGTLAGYNVASSAYFSLTNFAGLEVTLANLALSSTPGLTTGSFPDGKGSITLRNVDSGDTINVFEYRDARGTLTESGSIYAASGASFNSGGISWEVVTTAACSEHNPFRLPPLSIWNTSLAAQTAKVEFVRDGVADLTDREIWLEIDYPASSALPNYTSANDRNANPFTGAGVDQPNSAVSWTGTGGFANENKQYVDVSFTAAEVGLLTGQVSVAKASTTLYVDPVLRGIAGSTEVVWMVEKGAYQKAAAGGAPVLGGTLVR